MRKWTVSNHLPFLSIGPGVELGLVVTDDVVLGISDVPICKALLLDEVLGVGKAEKAGIVTDNVGPLGKVKVAVKVFCGSFDTSVGQASCAHLWPPQHSSGEFGAQHMSLRHWNAQRTGSSGLQRCGIHVLSKYFQHLPQSAVGVGDVEDEVAEDRTVLFIDIEVEASEDTTVVLLAKMDEEDSQSSGILLPSSSSRESGARVQAGRGVSLLKELLLVTDAVVVDRWS
jgi:hypothetical protein